MLDELMPVSVARYRCLRVLKDTPFCEALTNSTPSHWIERAQSIEKLIPKWRNRCLVRA